MYDVTIRGSRGTLPICRADSLRYGGSTTCFSVRTPDGWLIIDAGTGLTSVAAEAAQGAAGAIITLLFTHFHMDHLIGFPCFAPLYDPATELTLAADGARSSPWRDDLRAFMRRPFWPVGLYDSDASMRLVDLPESPPRLSHQGIEVTWFRVPHPQQCLAYRLSLPARSIVVATDVEYEATSVDPAFVSFCRGADYLLFDAQYTPEEYPAKRGWGHSTWETAAAVARSADVGHLVLIHHDPSRTDSEVDALVAAARERFPATVAASENMRLV